MSVEGRAFGLPVDQVLLDYFGMPTLRNREVQEHLSRVWDLLKEGDDASGDFVQEMAWLEGHLSPSDIEFARLLLERAKLDKRKRS